MPGNVDRPPRQRGEERDVLRRLVRPALAGAVVGGAVRDQYRADVLVPEIDLQLLERTLDEKRRVRVHDRPVALERETGRDADHQLLADADVEDSRMPWQLRDADVGEDDRDPLVARDCLARSLVEPGAHGHRRISTTTQPGRPRTRVRKAAASAS